MSEEQQKEQQPQNQEDELNVSKDDSDDEHDEDYKEETSEESEDELEYNSHDEEETESEEELNDKFSTMSVNHKVMNSLVYSNFSTKLEVRPQRAKYHIQVISFVKIFPVLHKPFTQLYPSRFHCGNDIFFMFVLC